MFLCLYSLDIGNRGGRSVGGGGVVIVVACPVVRVVSAGEALIEGHVCM